MDVTTPKSLETPLKAMYAIPMLLRQQNLEHVFSKVTPCKMKAGEGQRNQYTPNFGPIRLKTYSGRVEES